MNLTVTSRALPSERILLIEGAHDLMSPKQGIEDFWQSWGQTDIWRLPHGHVCVCCGFVPGLPQRVLHWLAARLEARTVLAKNCLNRKRISSSRPNARTN
jgi:hypothetical protein